MKDTLETTRDITKLIKFSPRRDGIFQSIKETLPAGSTLGVRVLCPARCTIRAESICSIIANYEALEMSWDEAKPSTATHDTETKARIQGVAAQMRTFEFFFGSMLGELVLKHTDNLNKTLQHASTSAAEGQQVTAMMVATLNSVHSDEWFDQFWEVVIKKVDKLGVNEP